METPCLEIKQKVDIVLVLDKDDAPYVDMWRNNYRKHFNRVEVTFNAPLTFTQLQEKYPGFKFFVCSNRAFFDKIIKTHSKARDDSPSWDAYAGSIYPMGQTREKADGREVLITRPLWTLVKVEYGKFLMDRYLSKFYARDDFLPTPPHKWYNLERKDLWDSLYAKISKEAVLCTTDVETTKENLRITMTGFSFLLRDGSVITIVIPYSSPEHVFYARKYLSLPVVKGMHNGHYDCSYFLRHNQPPANYLLDSYHLQHCYYSELPKSLAFCSSFWIRDIQYWKEERKSMNVEDKIFYNAQDCFNTLRVILAQLHKMPEYVARNYEIEFPKVFPAFHAGMYGLPIDLEEMKRLHDEKSKELGALLSRIQNVLGIPTFNPGSSQQVSKLFAFLSGGKIKKSDKISIQDFRELGPLQEFIGELIVKARKAKKAISSYFELSLLHGRLHYKLDVAGTETGRLASKASDFWCGTQIQNIPGYAKSMVVSEEGWEFCEADNSQSESRTSAYLAQDLNLINTVETSPDFHCTNASLFFGIPFEQLYDALKHEVLNKNIRQLSKRVNHGANYNMGAYVLLNTMGTKAVQQAKILLGYPSILTPVQVCERLLASFDAAYPRIRHEFQQELIWEIKTTGRLVLPNGWTRICFGDPTKSKHALNKYVAHKPQSFSVMAVNQAFFNVWKKYQIEEWQRTGKPRIRFRAQIHDSIFFSYRVGDAAVVELVRAEMRIPLTANGRTFIIPNDAGYGETCWGKLKH